MDRSVSPAPRSHGATVGPGMQPLSPGGVRWTANKDGLAHATPGRGRQIRTLCGLPALQERFGWPVKAKCPSCQAALVGEA